VLLVLHTCCYCQHHHQHQHQHQHHHHHRVVVQCYRCCVMQRAIVNCIRRLSVVQSTATTRVAVTRGVATTTATTTTTTTTAASYRGTAAKPKVIVITGATCVGKTNVAVEVAKQVNGEVISCDSGQVLYRSSSHHTCMCQTQSVSGSVLGRHA
jgi:hypothetical protein